MSEHDPFDVVGQAEQQAERKDRAQLELENEIGDLKWLMGNKRGRRVVRRQLEQARIYQTSFSGEATHQMAFNEGQRNAGLRLIALVTQHCAEQYALLLKEQSDHVD